MNQTPDLLITETSNENWVGCLINHTQFTLLYTWCIQTNTWSLQNSCYTSSFQANNWFDVLNDKSSHSQQVQSRLTCPLTAHIDLQIFQVPCKPHFCILLKSETKHDKYQDIWVEDTTIATRPRRSNKDKNHNLKVLRSWCIIWHSNSHQATEFKIRTVWSNVFHEFHTPIWFNTRFSCNYEIKSWLVFPSWIWQSSQK